MLGFELQFWTSLQLAGSNWPELLLSSELVAHDKAPCLHTLILILDSLG